MSMKRAQGKILYRHSLHRSIRAVTEQVFGFKGYVSLVRRRQAFLSMDPQHSANAAKQAEWDISRMAERAVRDLIKNWVKEHDYDLDSLCAAGIQIQFEFDSAPPSKTAGEMVNILAEMYAVEPS